MTEIEQAEGLSGLADFARILDGAPELDLEPGIERARFLAERLGRHAEALKPPSMNALRTGLMQLTAELDAVGSDAVIAALLSGLRQQRPGAAAEFLAQWLTDGGEAGQSLLYPHAFHEILLGARRGEGPAQNMLHEFVGSYDPDRADVGFARLQRLDAVRLGRLARRFFAPTAPRNLFPALARLVEAVPGSSICTWLLQCMQEDPPEWKGSQGLRALSPHATAVRPIVLSILREDAWQNAAPALIQKLSAHLAKRIETIPPERRQEPWVVSSLEALADLPSSEASALCKRILMERRFIFVPEWPAACRRAARASKTIASHPAS